MVHENCDCSKYAPDFSKSGIRYSGNVFRCKGCEKYVDGRLWKGGLKHFGNRTRILKYYECPCCGRRMAGHRRSKSRLVESVNRQIQNPSQLQPHLVKILSNKKKILQKIHTHTIHE